MFNVPAGLNWLEKNAVGREWLRQLPAHVQACVDQWSLRIGPAYSGCSVSIVFPVLLADGARAVLKVQYPHRESEHEAEALRQWNGQGAVRLLASNPEHHALLMERCEPGDHLSTVSSEEALKVFTQLLPRLWIKARGPFVSLQDEATGWAAELPSYWERAGRPFERALLEAALEALNSLPGSQGEQVLLHQDLHGDNVLRAGREPWLVIDPKPLTGEREFAVAPIVRAWEFGHSRQHVLSRLDRLTSTLGLNRERARLWSLAQTLAWAIGDGQVLERHVQTARWLWQG